MALTYRTGQEIRKGDRVLFFRNPATVELVALDDSTEESRWLMQEYGGGVMILDPMVSGRTFISADQIAGADELEFVSRAEGAKSPES